MIRIVEKEWEVDGYKLEVVFTDMGHRNGYMHLPKGHELEGLDYNDTDFEVHGGLTFSKWINDRWVFGFDCAHCWDRPDIEAMVEYGFPEYIIDIRRRCSMSDGTVKTQGYVERELNCLLRQIQYGGSNDE